MMPVSLRFLGISTFEITTAEDKKVLIDPFLDENKASPVKVKDLKKIDLLLVTHGAWEHIGDALQILRKFPDTHVLCGPDVRYALIEAGIEAERAHSSPWSMMVEINGVKVRPVESRHWSFIEGQGGKVFFGLPLGYIVYASDKIRIYHSDDTCLFSDMKVIGNLYRPNIGLLNVGYARDHGGARHGISTFLSGEMDAIEAAMAADWLHVTYALPHHYDDPTLPEVVKFGKLIRRIAKKRRRKIIPIILKPGESLTF
jgi:L-ascorbate metabolism protein UlaG (beta-lactamase superfamily)